MFTKIRFCIGNNHIEFENFSFPLGEISASVLNITPEVYHTLKDKLSLAKEKAEEYEASRNTATLKEANRLYYDLRNALCDTFVFHGLNEESEILYNTIEEEGDAVAESHLHIYRSYFSSYERLLYDLASFNQTMRYFITHYLNALKKLNAENYAAALNDFLFSPRAWKYIANPIDGTGLFTNADDITVRYIPRETFPGSDEYKIYEYYDVESLQALLKMDFYKALEAGHIIRRCEYCGRFFLLKKAYHTKYCDKPSPDQPKYTCAQLGYRKNGIKERIADNPKAQVLRRCLQRIDKDHYRGIISDEERTRLKSKAQDLYFEAMTHSEITSEELEETLSSQKLYANCNVERMTAPRGRPKKS